MTDTKAKVVHLWLLLFEFCFEVVYQAFVKYRAAAALPALPMIREY